MPYTFTSKCGSDVCTNAHVASLYHSRFSTTLPQIDPNKRYNLEIGLETTGRGTIWQFNQIQFEFRAR